MMGTTSMRLWWCGWQLLVSMTRSSSRTDAFVTTRGRRKITKLAPSTTTFSRLISLAASLENPEATTRPPNNPILWEPSAEQIETSTMRRFQDHVGVKGDYADLWQWSVDESDLFWLSWMDFCGMEYEGNTTPVKIGHVMPDVTYFPHVRLNVAENLLRHGKEESPLRQNEALVSLSEACPASRKSWTFGSLRDDASRIRTALQQQCGVDEASAVGAYMPNIGETIVAMLGTTSTGAIWTSCSDDFGPQAVADRFAQVAPLVLFTVNAVVSKGQVMSMRDKIEQLVEQLDSVECVVVVELVQNEELSVAQMKWSTERLSSMVISYDDFLTAGSNDDGSAPASHFTKVPFAHPQFVLYSSGTTGAPKSIAHGAGNVLLQHAKELLLHSDLKEQDRMLYYTSCGWMMWNWMASSLFGGATVVTFDGFAAYPRLSSPWELVAKEKITHLGTTPRYLQACRKRIRPGRDYGLDALRVIFSTGSPLMAEDFDYVYEHVKSDVMLASISGGTDICSCFVLGNPILPVRRTELQSAGLGLDIAVYNDSATTTHKVVLHGEKGELVCRSPFVAAPVCFFGDDDAKTKYRSAYFRQDDPGVWYHGDLVEMTGSVGGCGGMVIHGRSDTTLKPGGIRIGTAEVYRFAEDVDIVVDSLVIGDRVPEGQRRAGDINVILFVVLKGNSDLSPDVEKDIRRTIRNGASDAHVPFLIRQVQKIPYTKSGKKVELAVRDLFAGVEPKNLGALQDPSALDEYRSMAAKTVKG